MSERFTKFCQKEGLKQYPALSLTEHLSSAYEKWDFLKWQLKSANLTSFQRCQVKELYASSKKSVELLKEVVSQIRERMNEETPSNLDVEDNHYAEGYTQALKEVLALLVSPSGDSKEAEK